MNALSRITAGVFLALSSVFILAGVGLIVWGVLLFREQDTVPGIVPMVMGLVFCSMGGFAVHQGLRVGRVRRDYEELQQRYPHAPWMWHKDWKTGRIASTGKSTLAFIWLFAIVWNLVSWLAFILAALDALKKAQEPAVWLTILFPLVGIGVLAAAIYQTAMWRKYGTSFLVLETRPGVIGGELRGNIETTANLQEASAVFIRLLCSRVTQSGKNSTTTLLWQEELSIPRGSFTSLAQGTVIPVRIAIPYTCEETSIARSHPAIRWNLQTKASVPGVDYAASFVVPVFRTPESSPDVDGLRSPPQYATSEVSTEEIPQVHRRPSRAGGMEWFFPAAMNPGAAIGTTIFFLLWCGLVYFMTSVDAPVILVIVFGLFGVLFLWVTLQVWCGQSLVSIDAGSLTVRAGIFGIGRKRTITSGEVERVVPVISMQMGSRPYYSISLVTKENKKVHLGQWLRNKREADNICREMMEWLRKW